MSQIIFDEYYGESRENKIARLLWLWYDYHTEQHDRTFPYVEGQYGEAMILDRKHRSISNIYAGTMMRQIWSVANKNGVWSKHMTAAKNDSYRNLRTDVMIEDFQQMVIREGDLLTEIGLLIK